MSLSFQEQSSVCYRAEWIPALRLMVQLPTFSKLTLYWFVSWCVLLIGVNSRVMIGL